MALTFLVNLVSKVYVNVTKAESFTFCGMKTLIALCCVALVCSIVLCDLPSSSSPAVNAHNTVRAQVSPAASPNLPPLTWSPTVADFSSTYANNCVFAHSSNSTYGENLYMTSDTSLGESAIVSVKSFTFYFLFKFEKKINFKIL